MLRTSKRSATTQPTQPHFIGDVVTKWLRHDGDDRLMQLRESFTFVDSRGHTWTAPKGFIFDGTTIPRALWTVFGDPFIGDYRRAAVIHDMHCTPHCPHCGMLAVDRGRNATPRYVCARHPNVVRLVYSVSSDEAAAVFYEAMQADGVSALRARTISRAVARFGPQFTTSRSCTDSTCKHRHKASRRADARWRPPRRRPRGVMGGVKTKRVETSGEASASARM